MAPDTTPEMAPQPPHAPAASTDGRDEPLPYFAPGAGAFRASLWEAAPGRCTALAAAWALALLALFLPGCDLSAAGNRTGVRPTSTVYLLTAQYTGLLGQSLLQTARGMQPDLSRDDVPLAIACPMFLLGSVAFLLTPALLRRRLRRGLRMVDWLAVALLPAPWGLLAAAAAGGNGDHFLYGYYLLAAAHTAAFVVLAWPLATLVPSPPYAGERVRVRGDRLPARQEAPRPRPLP